MIPNYKDRHPHISGRDGFAHDRREHRRSGLMGTTALYDAVPAMLYYKGGGFGGFLKGIVMGAVLGAVTGGIGFAALPALGFALPAGATLGSMVASGAVMGAIGGVLQGAAAMIMGTQQKDQSQSYTYEAHDNKITVRNTTAPRKKIYGTALAAGALVYATSTGTNNKYMHLVTPIASHQVKAFRECYFNNNPATDSRYSNLYRIKKHLGTQTQTADSDLVSEASNNEWTNAHRGRGIAYIYPRLEYDQNAWVSGLPSTQVMTDGAIYYDPRAAYVSISTSTIASPGVFSTVGAHGLSAGDIVFIKDHLGATYASNNGLSQKVSKHYTIDTVPSSTTFTLLNDSGEPMPVLTAGSGGTVSKCAWSNNWSLAILDYLLSRDGINCATDDIDFTYFSDAANVSDEDVNLGSTQTFTASVSSNQVTLSNGVGWTTGTQVYLSTTGTLPAPLSPTSPYYWIASDVDLTIGYLASSYINAVDTKTAIDISDTGAGTHSITLGIVGSANPNTDEIYLFSESGDGKALWVDNAYMAMNPDVLGSSQGGTGVGWWGNGSVGNFSPATSAPRGYDHYMTVGKGEGRIGTWRCQSYIETGDAITLSGSLPGGLSSGTTYYWINSDFGAGRVATSRANAMAGVYVDISGFGGKIVVSRQSQARYTVNGIVDLSKKPIDILNELLTAGGGVLVYTQGKYRLFAAAPATSIKTISQDNLRDDIGILPRPSRADLYNAVRGTYKEPAKYWEMTDFPPVTNATYEADDGGQRLYKDIVLPHTIDDQRAQRIASIALGRARNGMTINFPGTVKLLGISAWDCVSLNLDVASTSVFSNKKFRVIAWSLAENAAGVDLTLQEEADTAYDWSYSSATVSVAPGISNLPSPWDVVAPTNLTATETVYTTDGGSALLSALNIAWDASADVYVRQYSISYKLSSGGEWTPVTPSRFDTTKTQILGLSPGIYDVRVQAVNSLGAESAYLTLQGINVLGVGLLPALNPPQITSILESLVEINGGQGVNSQASVYFSTPTNDDWSAAGVSVSYYQVEYRRVGDTLWSILGTPDTSPLTALGAVGSFEWRVKATMSIGVDTPYSDIFSYELRGLTAPPADITGFSVQSVNGLAYVQWDASQDLDVKIGGFIRIKYTPLTTGATWNDGTDIGPQFPGTATHGVLPLLTGTYMIKSVDSSGNYSSNESSMNITAPSIQRFSGIIDISEHPSFSGVKTNMVISGSDLQLGTGTLFDDLGLIDSLGLIDYAGGIVSAGTYEFANIVDLGGVYTSRVTSNVNSVAFNTGDLIDSRTSDIDTWGSFDGTVINSVSLQLQIATTNDDPNSSPTWSAWKPFYIGDYSARGMKFRIVVTNSDPTANINISELSINVSIPHVTVDVCTSTSISASGQSFVYSSITGAHPFYSPPTINVTPSNMATGDYYLISSASRTGFTIQFFNSSGVGISRTADISASGFGQQTA